MPTEEQMRQAEAMLSPQEQQDRADMLRAMTAPMPRQPDVLAAIARKVANTDAAMMVPTPYDIGSPVVGHVTPAPGRSRDFETIEHAKANPSSYVARLRATLADVLLEGKVSTDLGRRIRELLEGGR